MKRLPSLVWFVLVFGVADLAWAQSGFQDFQKKVEDSMPKGRLLRKLRDDLRGNRSEDDKKAEKEREKEAKEAAEAAEQRNRGRWPTPSRNQPNQNESTERSAFSPPERGRYPSFSEDDRPSSFRPTPAMPVRPGQDDSESVASLADSPRFIEPRQAPAAKRASVPAKGSAKRPEGFGIVLDEKGEKLVVTEVDPQGNAYAAGVRRGDELRKLGGVSLTTIAEFDEVAQVMKNGDEIEFTIARKGKSDTFPVTFGFLDKEAVIENLKDATAPDELGSDTVADFAPPVARPNANRDSPTNSVMEQQNQSSLLPNPSISLSEKRELERKIKEQQLTIQRLQKEIESLKGSSRNRNDDPPLGS